MKLHPLEGGAYSSGNYSVSGGYGGYTLQKVYINSGAISDKSIIAALYVPSRALSGNQGGGGQYIWIYNYFITTSGGGGGAYVQLDRENFSYKVSRGPDSLDGTGFIGVNTGNQWSVVQTTNGGSGAKRGVYSSGRISGQSMGGNGGSISSNTSLNKTFSQAPPNGFGRIRVTFISYNAENNPPPG